MKNFILVSVMFITANLFGQLDFNNINLNDYKDPDYKYRSLYLYFDLNGKGSISIKNDRYSDYMSGNGGTGLNLNASCHVVKNSRKKQFSRFTIIGLSPNIHLSKEYNTDVNNKISFFLTFDNRTYQKYYIFKKMFFETDIFLSTYNKAVTDIDGEKGYINSNNNLRLPLMIGFGRIENITSAWHAIRIVEDLQKDGVIKEGASFSEEDIISLANFVTDRNYTRSFDYRKKLKDDIVGLRHSILSDKVDFNNPLAYASIFDMWQNGVNTLRRSGYTIAFGLEPGLRLSYFDNDRPNYSIKALDLFLITRLDYARALSKKWQLDFTIELKGGANDVLLSDSRIDDDVTDNLKPRAYSNLSFTVGYFPNTRTSFSSTIKLRGNMSSPNPDSDIIHFNHYFLFDNNLYYYINSRNRLSFHFNVSDRLYINNWQNFNQNNNSIGIDFGIGYSLGIF